MLTSSLVAIFAVFPALVSAQDLGVPLTWREFSNNRSLSERITIAQDGINAILPQLDTSNGQFNGIGFWQSGNVFTAMANQDRFAGTTVNQAQVVNNLNLVFSQVPNYDSGCFNDDAMWWAQAAIAGYRAYNDSNLLSHAISVWNHVTEFAITQAQANSGSNPNKDFTVAGECFGFTMAGGVFWQDSETDQAINSVTTGLYIATSALLAEITGDSKYTNAAILSAEWIRNININSDNIVLDTVNGHNCTRSPSTEIFTYNSGKYLEGLSILADVTGDSQWRTLMVTIAAAAMKDAPWQGSDGIITEGSDPTSNNDVVGFKTIFIRGLCEVFERNPSNTDLRILIHSYTDVQYNALLDLAANGNSYSNDWHGPPPQEFITWGQLSALDVLGSAIVAN